MQRPLLSLHSVLEALELDAACISLLEQTPEYQEFIHADTPEAIYNAIRTIGSVLNASQQANQLAENLEERINIISHKLKFIADENKPKAVFFRDVSPISIVEDGYLANLIRIAGGIHQTEILTGESNPDLLIIFNEKPISQLLTELPQALSTWARTQAVTNNQIYIIHHPGYLRRPGARVADDTEILAEIFYPKYFVFGRDADVWMKFDWQ
ncbi:ABC transporter substrate-binding protein [Parapedobacter indicus]|uniref:Iron complex transport system substrate-binding protein n=1 Tax=Parapedobacter indicus TaxID=1477437 RepID=A0A1I3MX38_9SPHI|nr:ABC transporter substrate-binding protein [Parapedobacter indicus]PPL00807.1 iron complex transport system substrate-binding protein [Parapedobacter indicus]SFJ01573.1 iron complex transport system substrate-binding protein [Parapedobacter indicus]